MNEATTIKLNGKTFVLKFGMKVLRLLSIKWQVLGFNQLFQRLAIFDGITDDLSFEQIDVINDLILCAVAANEDNTETITAEELDDLYLHDAESFLKQVEIVFKGFMASMPQAKDQGKPKAAKTRK
jgi:hypothetical protein